MSEDFNYVPATASQVDSNDSSSQIPEESYMKYAQGYDSDGYLIESPENVEEADDSIDESIGTVETPVKEDSATEQSSFEIDGVDLNFVPENLRRDTLADTLKAVEDSRKSAETLMTRQAQDASDLRKLIQAEGFRDSHTMQMAKNVKAIDQTYEQKLTEAEYYYSRLIETGDKTTAEANFLYGQYASELAKQRETLVQKEHTNTNSAIIDKFVSTNQSFVENPILSKAAEVFFKDILADGDLIDEQRTAEYVKVGQSIWDEAYKAGIAAAKGAQATVTQQTTAKQKMATQVTNKGGTRKAPSNMPWSSASEVPQNVWNTRADVRRHFGC